MLLSKHAGVALLALAGMVAPSHAQTPVAQTPPVQQPRITVEEANKLLGGPTLITLNADNVPVRDILADISKQAGLSLNASNNALRSARDSVTLQLAAQPFWLAVKALAAKTRYTFAEVGSSSNQVTLQPTTGERGLDAPNVVSGPFLITISELKRVHESVAQLREVAVPPPKVTDVLGVQMHVFIDPKVPAVPFANRIVLQQATDDKGNSLLGENMEWPYSSPARFTLRPTLYLNTTVAGGTRLAHLKGELRTTIATRYDTWEVTDPLQAKDLIKIGAAGEASEKYTIKEVKKVGNNYVVSVAVVRPELGIETRAAGEITLLDLALYDKDGVRLDQAGGIERRTVESGASRRQPGHAFEGTITVSPLRTRGATALAEPTRLVWRIPTEFKEVVVPFEFKDLPLPLLP